MPPDPNLLALISVRNIGALAIIKSNGRPQLSTVNFTFDPTTTMARISIVDGLAIAANLRRDPRASIFVGSPDGRTYAVIEGTFELSAVARVPDDETVEELVDVFRAIRGEDHPDWAAYRAAMVAEARMVATLRVDSLYGLAAPQHARIA